MYFGCFRDETTTAGSFDITLKSHPSIFHELSRVLRDIALSSLSIIISSNRCVAHNKLVSCCIRKIRAKAEPCNILFLILGVGTPSSYDIQNDTLATTLPLL